MKFLIPVRFAVVSWLSLFPSASDPFSCVLMALVLCMASSTKVSGVLSLILPINRCGQQRRVLPMHTCHALSTLRPPWKGPTRGLRWQAGQLHRRGLTIPPQTTYIFTHCLCWNIYLIFIVVNSFKWSVLFRWSLQIEEDNHCFVYAMAPDSVDLYLYDAPRVHNT